jgi:hypothetical protein
MNELVLGIALLASSPGPAPAPGLKLPEVLIETPAQPARWVVAPRTTQTTPASKRSSTAAKVVGTALGALGGFWAGGAIGFYTAMDRNADDDGVSGLRGVVIGAPIGAVVGAVLGFQLAN